jgi:hypothetical protein
MGIFSGIGKAFKSVFKGIAKVFEPILKPLGKLMNSKLGKAIMIGLSIFTLGSAMVAGYGAFTAAQAAGQGFVSAFVEGGKVFLQTLVGKGPEAADKLAGPTVEGAQGAMQTGETLSALEGGAGAVVEAGTTAATPTGALPGASTMSQGGALSEGASTMAAVSPGQAGAGSGVAGSGGMGGMPDLPVPAGTDPALQASTGIAPTTAPGGGSSAIEAGAELGWLDKAKNAAKGFAEYSTSEGGGQVVGSLIQGVGNYYTEKDRQEFEDRIRRQWGKGTGDAGIRNIREGGARVGQLPAPSAHDIATAGRTTAQGGQNRPYFDRPYGAAAGG